MAYILVKCPHHPSPFPHFELNLTIARKNSEVYFTLPWVEFVYYHRNRCYLPIQYSSLPWVDPFYLFYLLRPTQVLKFSF